MNSLHEAFERRAGNAGTADLDIDELVGLGEHRLRRRRLTAVLGGTVAVVLAITLGVGIALNRPTTRSQEPAHPLPTQAPPARQIVYSDQRIGIVPGHTVHFGDREVDTGNNHVHLDVTDDGFLYTDRGGVWFSDGGTPERVGSQYASRDGELGNFANQAVMAGNSGSTAAWFDYTPPARPTLVVFDTSSHQEVARRPVPFCKEGCELVDVTSDYVYIARGGYVGWPRPDYRFDLRANRLRASTPREYAEDLRAQPRGLILGDDWQSGTPITGDGFRLADGWQLRFAAVGSRLVPVVSMNDRDQATSAFDTATRRVLRLRLPAGYHVKTGDGFGLFEWVDDDTVSLFGGRADILTCQLSTGRCVLAVPGPDADTWRIVPNFPLPG